MGVVTSPASYRMFARLMPRFYPPPRGRVPDAIARLMREAARRRGLEFVDEERGLVRSHGAPRDPARLRGAKTLAHDEAARFYLEVNPRFDDGVALLLWAPLDVPNLLGALARNVRATAASLSSRLPLVRRR